MVTPIIQRGAGRFALVYCPDGHLIKMIPYKRWKAWNKQQRNEKMKCFQCGIKD